MVEIFLYLFTLGIRLFQLKNLAVYPDEITWTVYGKEILYAIKDLNYNYLHQAWWNSDKETFAISIPLVYLSGLFHIVFAGEGKYSLHWFPDITASRLGVLWLVSFTPVCLYWFLSRVSRINKKYAFLGALCYSISPIVLASDRWLLNDSLLTLFCFISLTSFVFYSNKNRLSFWPGVFLALTFLTKPHGLAVISGWLTYIYLHPNRKQNIKMLIGNMIFFLLTITILWPESWFRPVISIFDYFTRQAQLSSLGNVIYYLGVSSRNPHWSYYAFQFFTRLPEAIVILCILETPKARRSITSAIAPYVAFILVFTLIISFAHSKPGARYMLPIIPWVYVLATLSFKDLISKVSSAPIRNVIYIICLLSVISGLKYVPNYSLYYNQFIQGPENAKKFDTVGLCLGDKAAFNYLDSKNNPGLVYLAGCYDTAPYHTSRQITHLLDDANYIIVESAFSQQYPNSPILALAKQKRFSKEMIENGVVTSRIYSNDPI